MVSSENGMLLVKSAWKRRNTQINSDDRIGDEGRGGSCRRDIFGIRTEQKYCVSDGK